MKDYDFIAANPGVASSGALKCFCNKEIYNDLNKAFSSTYGSTNNEYICYDYSSIVLRVFVMLNSLKYFITGVNFVLRTVCILLVNWIGYETETMKLNNTVNVTFYVQFFNTAFLLLLVNANLSEQPLTFGLDSGPYSDFDDDWYLVIGNALVGTMVFTAIFPVIEAVGFWGMRLAFRLLDKRFKLWSLCDSTVTSKTSISSYIATYSGPVYAMHFKYASLLNIVFITFLYGFGIPVLFPISAFAILVLYLTEKTMLYYAYKQPPMYDEKLSQSVLSKLRWAPVCYMAFGYWMVTNKQLISNDYLFAEPAKSMANTTGHVVSYKLLYEAFYEAPAWPLYAMFWVFLIFIFFGAAMDRITSAFWGTFGDNDLEEDLQNYWNALDDKDRDWSRKEEQNCRDKLHFSILTEMQYNALINSASRKR